MKKILSIFLFVSIFSFQAQAALEQPPAPAAGPNNAALTLYQQLLTTKGCSGIVMAVNYYYAPGQNILEFSLLEVLKFYNLLLLQLFQISTQAGIVLIVASLLKVLQDNLSSQDLGVRLASKHLLTKLIEKLASHAERNTPLPSELCAQIIALATQP